MTYPPDPPPRNQKRGGELRRSSGCKTLNVAKSEEISRAFYAQLGADGLANRTRPEWNEQIVAAVIDMLPTVARVLDVGCGYGRVALPLSHAGYEVEGIDLAPNLIEAARRAADAEGARINFTVGSMTRLPYAEGFVSTRSSASGLPSTSYVKRMSSGMRSARCGEFCGPADSP